jgi:hypothetical protein
MRAGVTTFADYAQSDGLSGASSLFDRPRPAGVESLPAVAKTDDGIIDCSIDLKEPKAVSNLIRTLMS